MKWNECTKKLPKLKPVRNQVGELIGKSSGYCVVFGDNNLTLDYYIEYDAKFKEANKDAKLEDGWMLAKFHPSHWMGPIEKPNEVASLKLVSG